MSSFGDICGVSMMVSDFLMSMFSLPEKDFHLLVTRHIWSKHGCQRFLDRYVFLTSEGLSLASFRDIYGVSMVVSDFLTGTFSGVDSPVDSGR